MVKRIFLILITLVIILGIGQLTLAATSEPEAKSGTGQTKEAENMGNKICPVSGDKIKEKTKATYEYEGKIYNFCCPMCIEAFKKDPQKYITKVGEEIRSRAQAEGEGKSDATTAATHLMQQKEDTHQGGHMHHDE